jgi:hypothetical protein
LRLLVGQHLGRYFYAHQHHAHYISLRIMLRAAGEVEVRLPGLAGASLAQGHGHFQQVVRHTLERVSQQRRQVLAIGSRKHLGCRAANTIGCWAAQE